MMNIFKNQMGPGCKTKIPILAVSFLFVLQVQFSNAENRFVKFRNIGDPVNDEIKRGERLAKPKSSELRKSKAVTLKSFF